LAAGLGLMLAVGAFRIGNAHAAPSALYVSPTGLDTGSCPSTSPCATVTYALQHAASGATIKVSGTIDDHVNITAPVTITTWTGGPAGSPGVLDGTGTQTVVTVSGITGVTIQNITIQHGALGILNSEGTVTLADSTVWGNATTAEPYAGLWNYGGGTMTIVDSTVANNSGNNTYGAGVYNTGTMTVVASTIAANTGGGIYSGQGHVATLGATIVANNTGSNCLPYEAASLASAGYNLTNDTNGTACAFTAATDLVNKNPLLGTLAKNGGPTETILPASKSPAGNVIPNPTSLRGVQVCPGTDQRGHVRPGNGESRCTIGAAEVSASKLTTSAVTATPATVKTGTRVAYLIVVTPKSGTGVPTGPVTFTIGTTTLCKAVLSGGVAACGATNAPVGTDTVTGTYLGGNGYGVSSATTTLVVTAS
jgi:hypothetical protein